MKISKNTVLITGGSAGIGLALAESLLEAGNEVIICGRRESKLLEAKENHPEIHTKVCDVSKAGDRKELVEWVTKNFENLNVLVNNAGIQRDVDFTKGEEDLLNGGDEIAINFEAPIYLSAMLIPHLMKKEEAAIVNVSSGLAITPMALFPVYCATKAGIHSFSQTLRHQLSNTNIKVFEVLPPALDTELNSEGRKKRAASGAPMHSMMDLKEYVDGIVRGLERNEFEIRNPALENLEERTFGDLDNIFGRMNSRLVFGKKDS